MRAWFSSIATVTADVAAADDDAGAAMKHTQDQRGDSQSPNCQCETSLQYTEGQLPQKDH